MNTSALLYNSSEENFCALADHYNHLTSETAETLAIRAHAGNAAAAEQLILGHLHLVCAVVSKCHSRINTSDLLHEGIMGLYDAIHTFIPGKGSFRTHAIWHVRYYIQKAIAGYGFATRISEEHLKHLMKVNRIVTAYLQENGFEPSAEEVADITHYQLSEVQQLLAYSEQSLDDNCSLSDEFYNPCAAMLTADEQADDLLCRCETAELVDRYTDPREAYIIRSFYGIDCPQKDAKTLAFELHLTEQRIRQIKAAGLEKLRAHRESFIGCAA